MDGWLIYDFQASNPLGRKVAGLKHPLSRRFFYWKPNQGRAVKIVHALDAVHCQYLDAEERIYTSRHELSSHLRACVEGKTVAMEYSFCNELPYISKVDAGVVELVKSLGASVVSSQDLLQPYTSVLTDEQLASHIHAAEVLQLVVQEAFDGAIGKSEREISRWIHKRFHEEGCTSDFYPIVAIGPHAAEPHHSASNQIVQEGDFLLIDLWCKKREAHAIYADICRVRILKREPTELEENVFQTVLRAQKEAIELLRSRFPISGAEVDKKARSVIEEAGFAPFFTHRTGHNIHEEVHGSGAHLDSFETNDTRLLAPSTCFSIEPGIYLPGQFGVRLETNAYFDETGQLHISGGLQETL